MVEFLKVGKIVNTMGVKGEVKVIPLTNDVDRFNDLEWVYILRKDKRDKINIQSVRFHKNFVLIKFEGIDDMTAAERLKESYIQVDREHAVELDENEFFICDLIGCNVLTTSGEELGEVNDVFPTGANDVYVVKAKNGKEVMVPAIKQVIKSVDVENKKIIVELMEGLI